MSAAFHADRFRAEPGEHEVGGDVAVDPADLQTRLGHAVNGWAGWWGEAEVAQLAVPRGDQVGAAAGHDLVGPRVRPCAAVPSTAQAWSGLLVGVLGTPCGFVSVDVAVDLCGALAEPGGVRRELTDLAVLIEGVATCREGGPELGVAHHRGVPDPVECLDAVDDADRVQSTPRPVREDACVDLHVEVAVWVTGPRGVVAHDRCLDHLHRHLHLPATRTDPGGGVLGHPPDHLPSRPVHCRVVRGRDVGMECRGERPGLRPVDDDLDEPQRACVVAQPTLGRAGQHVVAGDPPLVGRTVEITDALHSAGAGEVVLGQAGAFGQVVVVGAGVVGLDVGARGGRRPPVELHSTVHPPRHRPSTLVT